MLSDDAEEEEECANSSIASEDLIDDDDNDDDPPPLRVMESAGVYGDSLVRIWEPSTGTIMSETKLEDSFFGEGSTTTIPKRLPS